QCLADVQYLAKFAHYYSKEVDFIHANNRHAETLQQF
ncbi:MAG: hypothetical protein ACI82Q_002366, partial [Nonlabens sp.]